ncbi:DUF4296 domain-containing protein [Pseudobacter ginsenosidimutans]|jgi:hypothetical protein|uniref:Uncharacterized protein DUF4296 n=1 Tax=Pseudobacter ginsenosidimutans TaxID=661488 RepID=A0A4Q7MMW5_9BACT|nr:DUF4296 domain-containing protein [Pseudobacter ginsenosidimutans]QEC40501.1 DUF4296 domain-containing protein [Pseudobacter ginsenosidimutans]RZS68888.1 uncharacterized protein DUF4296 [Pseudobacter ginsenosidimutans]
MMRSHFVKRKRGSIVWIIGIAVVLGLGACSDKNKVPSGVLDRESMQAVMWDMILADRYAITYFPSDTSKRKDIKTETLKLYDQVFQIHDISQEEFLKSYRFYLSRPDISKSMFDSIYTRANRKRDEELQERQREQQKKDSLQNLKMKDTVYAKSYRDSIANKRKADSVANKLRADSIAKKIKPANPKMKLDSADLKRRKDSVLNRLRNRARDQRLKPVP